MFHRASYGSYQLLYLEKDVSTKDEIDRSVRLNSKFPEHGERELQPFAWDVSARIDIANQRGPFQSMPIFAKRLRPFDFTCFSAKCWNLSH